MAEIFAGKWKLDRSENFDDYLKELGKFPTLPGFTPYLVANLSFSAVGYFPITTSSCIKSYLKQGKRRNKRNKIIFLTQTGIEK